MACTTVAHYYPRSRFGPSSVTGLCWSVTSSQAVYFQHRLTPQKLRRGKPVVGCGRSHRLFHPAPPEAWLTPDFFGVSTPSPRGRGRREPPPPSSRGSPPPWLRWSASGRRS